MVINLAKKILEQLMEIVSVPGDKNKIRSKNSANKVVYASSKNFAISVLMATKACGQSVTLLEGIKFNIN